MDAENVQPTADSGVGETVGKPEGQIASEATTVQSEVVAQEKPKPINLDELPEFRNFKSKIDKERARERKEYEQRLAKLEEQANRFKSLAERNLHPDELEALRQSELAAQLEEERRARQELEMMFARQSALSELSNRYGVPFDVIADVETPTEAYERILEARTMEYEAMNQRLAKLEQEMQARLAASSAVPVVGGDASNGGSSSASLQSRYDEAAMRRDVKEMERLIDLAMSEGVKLDTVSAFARKRT